MPEQSVWRGNSSQGKNLGIFILCGLFCCLILFIFIAISRGSLGGAKILAPCVLLLLAVPIFMALARYLQTKNKIYELTTERLKTTEGVFGKVTDTLELYRVKDIETRQPFLYRLIGIENIQINTSDVSSPFILVAAIPKTVGLADRIRNQVEAIRQQKGVREVDVE